MKKLFFLSLLMVCCTARADYIFNARETNSWQYINAQSFIIYANGRPVALIKILCCILPTSSVQILTDDLGPFNGKILIDGEVVEPIQVTKIN